jgi:hypothetical protein
MAITILQQPTFGYISGFNFIDFLVNTNNTQPIFEYQIKVKSGSDTIAQFTKPKSINGGKCHFDAQRTIQSFLSYDLAGIVNNTMGFYKANNVFKEFFIEFAERSGATFNTVSSGSPINSNTYTAINLALDYEDTFSATYVQSFIIGAIGNQFLTSQRGAPIRIKPTDKFELGLMVDPSSTYVSKLEIKTYNDSNTLIDTYRITNSFAGSSTKSESFLSVNVGAASLNSQTLSTGVQPIITDSVAYYTIQTVNASNVATSELLTFEIDRNCYKYTPIRLFWLNKYGRMDSFSFNFANDKSFEIDKSTYLKQGGVISGNSFVRSRFESGDTTFNNMIDTTIKLRTDYISTIESEWLSELVKSSIVWAQIGSSFNTVKVVNTSYTNKDTRKDGMFIEEIDVKFSNSSFRQRL